MRALAGIVTAALVLFVAGVAHGHANVVIVNADPVDAGFNDMTPATPIGGNCGTTLGAQRLAVFQRAAERSVASRTSSTTDLTAPWAFVVGTLLPGAALQAASAHAAAPTTHP